MNIQIRQMDSPSLHQVDQFNRNSMVNSHLMLHIQNNKISYSIIPVEPYEKILSVDPEDYTTFVDNPQKVIFFADVNGKPVGQIKLVPWWNKFAYVEELVVDTDFRGQGIGYALMSRAIACARQQGFPGLTLETQDNNVPACKFYEKCGFILSGFDLCAYKNLDNPTEFALYWYLIF